MELTDKVFVIGGQRYAVIEQVALNGKNYVFIANTQNAEDARFAEVVQQQDGSVGTQAIEPTLFQKQLLPLFLDKIQSA